MPAQLRLHHHFPSVSSRSTVEGERAFLLRNQLGDFLSLYTNDQTRYQGWFLQKGAAFYKILDSIEILSADGSAMPITDLTFTGTAAFWQYSDNTQIGWKMHPTLSGLSLTLDEAATLRIKLDIRGMYLRPLFERNYILEKKSGGYLLEYRDPTLPSPLFVHVRLRPALTLEQKWEEVSYPRDAARHSEPSRVYRYVLGTVTTDQLSIGAGFSAEEALAASLATSRQRAVMPSIGINHTHDTLLNYIQTSKASVQIGLRLLETESGLIAGLPWFHQVWSRDELLTALGLAPKEQRQIIERYLGLPLVDGELPTYLGSGTTCADGVGWLCLLVKEYGLSRLTSEERSRFTHFLQKAVRQLETEKAAYHGLISSGHNATWMDTIGRSGFRLEIQCMQALMFEHLAALTNDATYQQEQIKVLGRVRHFFLKNGYLWDGMDDPTKRPNVFLAYLLQPELLSESGWQQCFDHILVATQLEWGGLSSIDRADPQFHPVSTGEDNQSYHNGDSWFFINNLAGIALHRFNERRYGKTIVQLLQSSAKEILWENMIGFPGEISSAQSLESYGCGLQAFSAGTYLAFLKELDMSAYRQDLASNEAFWSLNNESSS